MKEDDQESCGVTNALKVIGSKWTILILRDLCEEKKRFGELQRSLEGISPRTLSQRLQELEKQGIISKAVFAEVPPRVEYALTERGKSLKKIIGQIREWGEQFA